MKIQALFTAIAMAFGMSAFAQTGAATADTQAKEDTAKEAGATPAKKTVKAKAKKTTKAKKAGTQAMGGPAATPETDLEASDRQARIDEAYAKWKAQNP